MGAIGDIVHTLPTLAAIRTHFSAAEISWVVERRSAEVLRGNPLIDNLIEVDTRSLRSESVNEMVIQLGRQVKNLRKHRFDVAIDFQGLLKSAVLAKLSGAKARFGFAKESLREPASRLFLTKTVDVRQNVHIISKNLSLAEKALNFTSTATSDSFPIFVEPQHIAEADEILSSFAGDFAVLNPAGGWVTKLWPAEKFGALAERLASELSLIPIVVTGPGEGELAERILSNSGQTRVLSVQPSIKGFYELVKRAKIYVGGDTGPTHIALAAGTPVVGLFGPTEWWRNGSRRADDLVVERLDIDCRVDCHRRTCSKWICMDIAVETVFAAAKQRIETAKQDI